MRRFFSTEQLALNATVQIENELFHHIFEVCRLQVGQHFELTNSHGQAFLVKVLQVGKKTAQVLCLESRDLPLPREPHIHLVLAVPRYPVFEAVLEKAVELGVSSIQLVYSDFSQVKTDSAFAFNKMDRWKKIVISATQQTGRGDLMPFLPPRPLFEVANEINQNSKAMGLFAYEGDGGAPLKAQLQVQQARKPQSIWVFVGSEGGFSTQEVEKFKSLDLHPVSLGEQILRVETACVTLVSALKYEFDLLG